MTNTRLPTPQAVLFDWDNTLVNNWPVSFYAVNKMLQHYNLPAVSMGDLKNRPGRSAREAFPEVFGDLWKEASDFYYESYREVHLDMLEPLPDAERILMHLQKMNIPIGIVSNKRSDNLRKEITHLGWDAYFRNVVGSYDTPHDKPSPEPVYHALKNFDLEVGPHIWFVGDNEVDILTAKNAQLTGIFINDSDHIDKLKDSHPETVCLNNLMNLIQYLEK